MRAPQSMYTENELVRSLVQNDLLAYAYLYEHYSLTLYGYIGKIIKDERMAEDILQEVFVKVWKKIKSYNYKKGSLFTWMLHIARNTAIDFLRMEERRNEIYSDKWAMKSAHLSSPAPSDLFELIGILRPERQVIIDMVYFQGYTQEEVALYLNVPLGTIKSRLRTALRELRRLYLQ